jgi:8-oxo-dGTP diphosphatase
MRTIEKTSKFQKTFNSPPLEGNGYDAHTQDLLQVAIGVIINSQQQILLSQRSSQQHLANLWEFPGGKVEAGETAQQALARELQEELGIVVEQASPLIELVHHYPQRSVRLQVFKVTRWQGEPQGREQQPLRWVAPAQLADYPLPAANAPILNALRLPSLYAISDEPQQATLATYIDDLLQRITQHHIPLLQLRAHTLSADDYLKVAAALIPAAHALHCQIILQTDLATAIDLNADGIHLNHSRLWQSSTFNTDKIISAACHSPEDLQQALRINATCALLSPVKTTLTHPQAQPLGWSTFQDWIADLPLPVYALGGMQRDDLIIAQQHGAQGIAGIRGFM